MTRALAAVLLAACHGGVGSSGPTVPTRAHAEAPTGVRLVVLVIVGQLPEASFDNARPLFDGGYARMLREGEWRVGVAPALPTGVAASHAMLGTGQPPSRSGIIANQWWRRDTNTRVDAVDARGGDAPATLLRVPALGDAVAAANHGAKAVSIALDVGRAQLPLGAHGLAISYDATTGAWRAHGQRAAWLPHSPLPSATWTPLDPAHLADRGVGTPFSHAPAPSAVLATPAADDIVLDVATAAITNEGLGRDRAPDLLIVSLPAHDAIARTWGPDSSEALDAELRLDRRLDAFLSALDTEVGADHWALVMTADHAGGTLAAGPIQRAANAAASTVLGPGEWIASASPPYVYLSAAALQQNKRELTNAYKKIVFALRAFPDLALADRTDQYAGNCDARTGEMKLVCLAIDPARAGEFIYAPSLSEADREVPVLLRPHGSRPHAAATTPTGTMSLADIAPLLASWLGATMK